MFFKYGAMNSGKSIDILKVAHNYEEQGKPVELLTSGIDDRSGTGVIASRIGLKRRVTPVMEGTDGFLLIKKKDHPDFCVLFFEGPLFCKGPVLPQIHLGGDLKIPVDGLWVHKKL